MRKLLKVIKWTDDYWHHDQETRHEIKEVPDLISSLKTGDIHRPVLDIDFPAYVIPSSTPGHFHLYLEKDVSWDDYEFMLFALKRAGIIEDDYYKMAIERKQTMVRLPWAKK